MSLLVPWAGGDQKVLSSQFAMCWSQIAWYKGWNTQRKQSYHREKKRLLHLSGKYFTENNPMNDNVCTTKVDIKWLENVLREFAWLFSLLINLCIGIETKNNADTWFWKDLPPWKATVTIDNMCALQLYLYYSRSHNFSRESTISHLYQSFIVLLFGP